MTTTPPAPTITPGPNKTPCPQIEVLVTPMPTDAVALTLTRTWAGKSAVVRGANQAPIAGDTLAVDYEAPFGVELTYTAQTFDVTGTPSALSPKSLTTALMVDEAWLSDPLDPSSAVQMALKRTNTAGQTLPIVAKIGSFAAMTYTADQAISPAVGSPLPFAFTGVRRQASSVPIAIRTADLDSADTLRALLMQAAPICLRTPPRVSMLTGVTFLALGDVVESLQPDAVSTLWSLTGTTVTPPGLPVLLAIRSYDVVSQIVATYADRTAKYPTYLATTRGP